ncbi:hypothetical protein RYX36_021479 [Vicia faba]
MAAYIIRRAFSQHILFLLPSSVLHVCENSLVKLCISDSTTRVFTLPTLPNFITESRRSFSKGRKPKDEGGARIASARMLDQEATTMYSFRSQAQRLEELHEFKSGKVLILLTTDVTGRGLDIPIVILVINYDVPRIP